MTKILIYISIISVLFGLPQSVVIAVIAVIGGWQGYLVTMIDLQLLLHRFQSSMPTPTNPSRRIAQEISNGRYSS